MGLLRDTERAQLLLHLQQLPNIVIPAVRNVLLAGLPPALAQSIAYTNIAQVDLQLIIDTADGDAFGELPDGSYSILRVIDNAAAQVAGSGRRRLALGDCRRACGVERGRGAHAGLAQGRRRGAAGECQAP